MLRDQALLFPNSSLECPTVERTCEIQVAKHVRLFLSFQLLIFPCELGQLLKQMSKAFA